MADWIKGSVCAMKSWHLFKSEAKGNLGSAIGDLLLKEPPTSRTYMGMADWIKGSVRAIALRPKGSHFEKQVNSLVAPTRHTQQLIAGHVRSQHMALAPKFGRASSSQAEGNGRRHL